MENTNSHEMLRRLLKASDEVKVEPEGEMTSGRVIRLAIARAAEAALGLSLTVLGVNQEVEVLGPVVKRLKSDFMLVTLTRNDEVVGVVGLDPQARAAAIEMQTLGQMRDAPAEDRKITPSDVALCNPLIASLLSELDEAAGDTELRDWTMNVDVGPRISDARAVGLALAETKYRYIEMTLDLGTGERQGVIVVALPASPLPAKVAEAASQSGSNFNENFKSTVMEAPAILHAVLHRMTMPLSKVAKFNVGDTLPLPGVTVASMRIEGPDGHSLARARLGQVTGMRAVRLEVSDPAKLTEVHLPDRATSPMAEQMGLTHRPPPQDAASGGADVLHSDGTAE